MIAMAMIWVSTILLGMLALGFFICCALMAYGLYYQRKDREMVMLYGIMLLFSAGGCVALIFAAIAVGRNLL
jgi:hypothetical protein